MLNFEEKNIHIYCTRRQQYFFCLSQKFQPPPPSRSENCWFLIASKENKHFHSFSNRIKTNSCIYLLYTNNAITRITLPHLVSINWEDLEYYPTRIFNYRTKVTTPHILDSARNISAKIGFNSFSGSSGYLNYKKFMGQRLSWASKN